METARIGLWGDSSSPVNPPDRNLAVPLDAERLPDQAEPLGGLLALFGALYDDKIQAVNAQGSLAGYHSLLQSPFCYLPHDVVVPGALTAGDLCDVAAALTPRPLRLAGLVDGRNRLVPADNLAETYTPAHVAYRSAQAQGRFVLAAETGEKAAAEWLLAQLTGP
jgi:hypothetical protein